MSRSFIRKPSLKKSLAAKYKAPYKRKLKSALIPGYGRKGTGWLHPRKKIYNTVYNKTSLDLLKLLGLRK